MTITTKLLYILDAASAVLSFGVGGVITSATKAASKGMAVSAGKRAICKACGVKISSKKMATTSGTTYFGANIVSHCYSVGMAIGSLPLGGPFGIWKSR